MKSITNKALLISIHLFFFSCVNKVADNTNLIKEETQINKQQLADEVYYSVDQHDSITFYVNNKTSQKFRIHSKDSTLLLDSILVYDGQDFSERGFYKSANNEFLIQTETRFGRVNIIGIDAEGNCSLIHSASESYFFDVVVDSVNHTFYTLVTGYGRNSGPFYSYKYGLNEMNTAIDSLTLKIGIVDRIDRLRYVLKAFR